MSINQKIDLIKLFQNDALLTTPVEFEVLLLAVQPELNLPQRNRLNKLLQSDLDWNRFLRLAQTHKVIPQVYLNFQEKVIVAIPDEVTSKLSLGYYSNIMATSRLVAELIRLAGVFKARNIPVLVLKGPVTGMLAYNSLNTRQFVDLDLVIRPDQLSTVYQILAESGYEPHFELGPRFLQKYTQVHYELTFRHSLQSLSVDVHWAILPAHFSFSPLAEVIWSNSYSLDLGINSLEVQTLSREDLLLYLCAHAAKDNWSSLGAICDIAGLLRNQLDLDWERIEAQVGQLGSRRMFQLGLVLAYALFNVPLPARIVAVLPQQLDLAGKVLSQFYQPPTNTFQEFITRNLYLKSMDKIMDRLHFWVDEVLTPTPYEWARVELPQKLSFLYYPLRLWHFGLKYLFRKPYGL